MLRIFELLIVLIINFGGVIMRGNNFKSIASSLLALLLFVIVIQVSENRQNWTVRVSESVQFPCNIDPGRLRNWEHDNDVLFLRELKIDFNLEHVELLDNYSLLIQEVTLPHEGIYRCWQDNNIVEEFLLKVAVPPKMFLTVNELDNVTKINVEAGTDVTLFCYAVGATPPVDLSWTTDEEINEHRALNFTVGEGGEYQGRPVFDSVSSHRFKLTRKNGIISCRSRTPSGVGNREISLQYKTFVVPNLQIFINGIGGIENIPVAANELVRVICNASSSRPKSHISVFVNNLPIESLDEVNETSLYIKKDDALFDTVSTVWYRPNDTNGSITCTSQFNSTGEIAHARVTYFTYVVPNLQIFINGIGGIENIPVAANELVRVICNASSSRPKSHISVCVNNLPIESLDEVNETSLYIKKDDALFDTVSTVWYRPNDTNGSIICTSQFNSTGEIAHARVTYFTYVVPNLQIFINGIGGIENIPVAANELVRVICNASSSRPKSHISLFVNNLPIESLGEVNETSFYIEQDDALFDTVSTVWYRPNDTNGSITCTSQFNSTGEIAHTDVTYLTYVIPDMYFTINGNKWINISTINFTANEMLTVICHAEGARPVMQLMWKLNTRNVNANSVTITSRDDQTYNITTFLKFRPNESEIDIMCFTRGLLDHNIFILANVQVTDSFNTDSYDEDAQSWKISGITLVLLLIAATAATAAPLSMFVLRKYFWSRSSHVLHQYEAPGGTNANITQSSPSENIPTKRAFQGLDLPEVPGETEISDYYPFSEDDYDSYFELKDKSSHHRMFRGKDMCLILKMSSGHLQSRWMGTISLSNNHKKCVVFSTVSDVTVKTGEIQWDTYVKRVLDMPHHNSLVKLEGICVNQANLYLVHEHLTCDSLESIVSSKQVLNNGNRPLPTSKVASYLMDILEGMEVLHSFGFLHPALSTKKVLVTDVGRCKLYDFFLSEDAPNRTIYLKSMKDCSIRDLPPEAWLRNEYTQASDVWCVAIVLWSLMTYDPIPVVLQTLNERRVCNVTQEWPASHLELKNHILFECWMYDEGFRPSINKLRSSFAEAISNVTTFPSSEDVKESTTDLYIPMDGIKTTIQHKGQLNRKHFSLEKQENVCR